MEGRLYVQDQQQKVTRVPGVVRKHVRNKHVVTARFEFFCQRSPNSLGSIFEVLSRSESLRWTVL